MKSKLKIYSSSFSSGELLKYFAMIKKAWQKTLRVLMSALTVTGLSLLNMIRTY